MATNATSSGHLGEEEGAPKGQNYGSMTTGRSKIEPTSSYVYVCLPEYGELEDIVSEPNLLVGIEWLRGKGEPCPPTESKRYLFTAFTVFRPSYELSAGGKDFCVLVQKDRWQQMPHP